MGGISNMPQGKQQTQMGGIVFLGMQNDWRQLQNRLEFLELPFYKRIWRRLKAIFHAR